VAPVVRSTAPSLASQVGVASGEAIYARTDVYRSWRTSLWAYKRTL